MLVSELIKELLQLPQDATVEINDNNGGMMHALSSNCIDYFVDDELAVIQVNL